MNKVFVIVFCLMLFIICVAFVTLLERKILGLVGLRLGPNKVFFMGIFQALGDACKLLNKQMNSLSNFTFSFYYLSSFMMLLCSLMMWAVFLIDPSLVEIKFSIIYIMVVLSFNSLNSIFAGWSTFSKYSLIGSIRTVSQLISYEAVLYLCLFYFCFMCSSFNVSELFFYFPSMFCIFFPSMFMLWVPSVLAELNRSPFDFSEGESELVSGFNTEFGSSGFTFLFLAEYSNILFLSFFTMFMFFFYSRFFSIYLFLILLIWIRSICPRFRFDKLMTIAWKFILPYLTMMLLCFILFNN